MRTFFQSIVTLIVLTLILSTGSCTKDPLYDVNDENINRDTTNIADTLISSLAFISDDYSIGMPSFTSNNIYTYSGASYDGAITKENLFVSSWDLLPKMNIRINPSNASLNGVEWKIIKRKAQTPTKSLTKLVDGDIVFDGEFTVKRSENYPAQLTFTITKNESNFFEPSGSIYAVVAVYTNGEEVVSDVACYLNPVNNAIKIDKVFLGEEVNGAVVKCDGYRRKLTENKMIVNAPQPYAVCGTDTTLLSELGIGSDQYVVELYDYSTIENSLPKADVASNQWAVGPEVGGIYSAYNYNEFMGEGKFGYYLYNSDKSFIAEKSEMVVYTEMDDVNVTTEVDRDVNGNVILEGRGFAFNGYIMDDFIFRAYGKENVTFTTDYTDAKCYIGDVEVANTDMNISWVTSIGGSVSYVVNVNKALKVTDDTLKVVLAPSLLDETLPTFTHTIALNIGTKPIIEYPTSVADYDTWGSFIDEDYQLTFALSEIFKNNQALSAADAVAGYTYKLSFASSSNNGVFVKNGVTSTILEGDFLDIENVLKNTQLGLGAMLTSDASMVTVKLETYFNGELDKAVESNVMFNNPIFILADNYSINENMGSNCSLKDGLTISVNKEVTGSKVIIFENGAFITTNPSFSPSSIIYERGTLDSKVSLSGAGVITANESLSGLSSIGNASITISVGSAEFGVKKSITPKVSVTL